MDKDWVGNTSSVFKTLGASNHCAEEREQHDFYATSPYAIDLLVSKVDLPAQILEPACGAGHLSLRLEELGHNVYSSDLIDRGFGHVKDFFSMTEPPFDGDFAIVTNPPYKNQNKFVLHALNLIPNGSLVCMFLKTTFAEGQKRYRDIFVTTPPSRFYNASKESTAPKMQTSPQGKKRGRRSVMPGGYGRKATKALQH